jgi:iron(II)-dependent oxidoreductase
MPQRLYPWGDAFGQEYANSFASGVGASNRLGSYPRGMSPYGCQELSGNVWEWTRSIFGKWDQEKKEFGQAFQYPYETGRAREDLTADIWHGRVIRGGSWENQESWSRCGFRDRISPYDRYVILGFRVVLSPFTHL